MDQQQLEALVKEVLAADYRSLEVSKYVLTEDIRAGEATLVCQLRDASHKEKRGVEGRGVGLVDALFNGLKNALSSDYPSLDHIHFVEFSVSGDFSKAENASHSDALGHVRLVVENTSGRRFTFQNSSKSMSASSVDVVVSAAEHFVNAELAVLKVYDWIEDAHQRSRPDLAEKYTHRLADLMQNASYSETIERRKQTVRV